MRGQIAVDGARKFEGPFLVLGVLPSWPAELEKRKDYHGPHSQLSALFPIKALPEVGGEVVDKAGPWKKRVERQARQVSDAKLARVLSVLDRPRTAKQIARKLHVSRPTVDYWVRGLQQSIGAALKISVRRQGSRGPKAKFFWVERHARA